MRIAVASGKGGTGKTLISTCLTRLWSDQGRPVTYVDADVEEPNGHLFLKPRETMETRYTKRVPSLEITPCSGCGKCQDICAFHGILAAKGNIIVFDELCHSCGACVLACPDQVLGEEDREIGTITVGTVDTADFFSGRLDVGEAQVAPLTEGVVRLVESNEKIVIIDAPPGTSCSAMAATRDADLVLLVTEPTPFGMHDLELAVGMGRALGRKLAAVINRADLGDDKVRRYLDDERIPSLAEIPFDRAVAAAYAESCLPIYKSECFLKTMTELGDKLLLIAGETS